ncbi:MAG: DUF4381 family protein [Verrucomicrobiales bacterium]
MNPTTTTTNPSLELREIKPAIEIPEPAGWPLWATIALLGLAAAAAAFAWWQWHRRNRAAAYRNPVDVALEELEKTREMISAADAETYAMAVSDVLRRDIERRLHIGAVRQTTEEFLQELTTRQPASTTGIGVAHRQALSDFLQECDLVKFARGQLDRPQRERLHEVARAFIQTCSEPSTPEPLAATATPQPIY